MGGGQYCPAEIYSENLAKHWFDTIHHFSYGISIYMQSKVVRKIDFVR